MPSSSLESNLASQMDEIDLLNSMYPDDLTVHTGGGTGQQSLDIRIAASSSPADRDSPCCSIHFQLGADYPSEAPPVYELSGPFLSSGEKREIQALMGEWKSTKFSFLYITTDLLDFELNFPT